MILRAQKSAACLISGNFDNIDTHSIDVLRSLRLCDKRGVTTSLQSL